MNDIVERARREANRFGTSDSLLLMQLADEIERLEAERAGDQHRLFNYESEIIRLKDLNTELVELLRLKDAELERLKSK